VVGERKESFNGVLGLLGEHARVRGMEPEYSRVVGRGVPTAIGGSPLSVPVWSHLYFGCSRLATIA
jgi:hypothetical protein